MNVDSIVFQFNTPQLLVSLLPRILGSTLLVTRTVSLWRHVKMVAGAMTINTEGQATHVSVHLATWAGTATEEVRVINVTIS